MAQKRMFSLQIVDTDAFLDMPISSQVFYFHLVMRADDEGFVSNPKKIMRLVGVQEDDMKILVGKRFILSFESGVVVIKHWLIHNTIRLDRFNKTTYQREKKLILVSENKAYTEVETVGLPDGNQMEPQVKLSKVKLSKEIHVAAKAASKPKSPKKLKPEKRKDDNDPYTREEFIAKMRESPHAHVRWIADYTEERKPKFETKGQWKEYLNRHLAPAAKIRKYSDEQIEKAFLMVEKNKKTRDNPKGYITKWGVETLLKFLDDANEE